MEAFTATAGYQLLLVLLGQPAHATAAAAALRAAISAAAAAAAVATTAAPPAAATPPPPAVDSNSEASPGRLPSAGDTIGRSGAGHGTEDCCSRSIPAGLHASRLTPPPSLWVQLLRLAESSCLAAPATTTGATGWRRGRGISSGVRRRKPGSVLATMGLSPSQLSLPGAEAVPKASAMHLTL